MGGTLLKYRKAGHNIFIAFTTSGNTGSNEMTDTNFIGETREKEALEAAKFYGESARVRAAFYGLQNNCRYAESFCGWRMSGYVPDFKLLP